MLKQPFGNQGSPTSVILLYRAHRFQSGINHFRNNKMLETIAIILIVLWALGLVSSYTMGGLIHVLLVIAIVVILIRVIGGRRV
jgi:hypothetical protein